MPETRCQSGTLIQEVGSPISFWFLWKSGSFIDCAFRIDRNRAEFWILRIADTRLWGERGRLLFSRSFARDTYLLVDYSIVSRGQRVRARRSRPREIWTKSLDRAIFLRKRNAINFTSTRRFSRSSTRRFDLSFSAIDPRERRFMRNRNELTREQRTKNLCEELRLVPRVPNRFGIYIIFLQLRYFV